MECRVHRIRPDPNRIQKRGIRTQSGYNPDPQNHCISSQIRIWI